MSAGSGRDQAELQHDPADDDPREILEWACSSIPRLAVATSFQSSGLVILDLLQDIKPGLPVLFLDTGFHFEETLEFRRRITELWDLNVVELRGAHGTPEKQHEVYGEALYKRDPDLCCSINKVKPLQDALERFDGWISGLRRDQSVQRSTVKISQLQILPSGRVMQKVHPLANWTEKDVQAHLRRRGIPTHPLLEKGYASIGCWPCTRPTAAGEDPRSGRWVGTEKNECGIHTIGASPEAQQVGSQ